MNSLARKFYEIGGESNIQEVVFLENSPKLTWEEISLRAPDLPRGWFELSRISSDERIEFISDLWLDRLPFHPSFHPCLIDFFSKLDDIAIVVFKRESEYQVEMVYSLADNSTFFRGSPPATEEDIRVFRNEIRWNLPRDYLSFLRLHNGFGKLSDRGILPIEEIPESKRNVSRILAASEKTTPAKGSFIDPETLIPFYEDFGLNSFQCFFSDWYPGSEMGNVYLSGMNYTISNIADRNFWAEQLAFPSFLEWLAIYLEGMNVSD